jgi:diguanylate cyclase (GGDEF)-like protein
MADFVAIALVNIKLKETLKQQATRDSLSDLFNCRHIKETINREISRANQHGTALGIIMLDLNHFKSFNNIFSHQAGDLVLQELGRQMQNTIRK